MARQTARAALVLSGEHRTMLKDLARSRTAAQREVERAKVLLAYADGNSPVLKACEFFNSQSRHGRSEMIHPTTGKNM